MAVFPESMSRVDPNDTAAAIATLESYIRYMQERIEFANRQTTRSVTEAGVTSTEFYLELTELQNTVQALSSTLAAAIAAEAVSQQKITALESGLAAAEDAVTALGDRVTAEENAVTALDNRVTDEQEARESAVEQLRNDLNAEQKARADADTALSTSISAEQSARESADAALQASIDALTERVAALEQ